MNFPAIKNGMLLTCVRNPWEPYTSRITEVIPFVPEMPVDGYVEHFGEIYEGYEIVASVNGQIIEKSFDFIPSPGSSIVFCAVPKGDDGKTILRAVAMVVVAVVSIYTGGLASAAYGGMWGAVAAVSVAATGGFLVNAVLPISSSPKVSGLLDGDFGSSKNYGWGAPSNSVEEGVVLPSLIGTRRFAPPLIRWYRYIPENEFTRQHLRIQYALADDFLMPVTANDIFINGEQLFLFYSKTFTVNAVEYTTYTIYITLPSNKKIKLNWGDGSAEVELDGPVNSYELAHGYTSTGKYTVTVFGDHADMVFDKHNLPVTDEKIDDTAWFHHTLGDDAETHSCPLFNDSIVENPFPAVELNDSDKSFEAKYPFATSSRVFDAWNVTRSTTVASTSLSFDILFQNGLYRTVTEDVWRDGAYTGRYLGQEAKKIPCQDYIITVRYRTAGTTPWTTVVLPAVIPPETFDKAFRTSYTISNLALANYEVQYMGSYLDLEWRVHAAIMFEALYGYTNIFSARTFTTNGDDVTKVGLGLIVPSGLYYLNDDGTRGNHTLTVNVDIRIYGSSEWIVGKTKRFSDATSDTLRSLVVFENLSPNKYEVRAYLSGSKPTDMRYVGTVYADFLQEGTSDPIVYRGVSILSLDIVASDKISSIPTVEVNATCADYYTGRPSSNPAWAAYYRLVDKHGVNPEDIIISEFEAWASWCDLNKYKVCLYLDTQFNLHDVLSQIGIAGRAAIVRRGTRWSVIQDAPSLPVQMFSMENIETDSFEETFLNEDEKANTILVWFYDEENDYRRSSVEIRDPNIDNQESIRKNELSLYGVTNRAQAISIAIATLNQTRLTQRTVSWRSDIDAIACQVGDVIYLQQDITKWGFANGRVVSSTADTVTIDRPADFSVEEINGEDIDGLTFKVFVRHQAPDTDEEIDFIETFELENPRVIYADPEDRAAVYSYTLAGSAKWKTNPEKDSIVSVGHIVGVEQSTGRERNSIKKFRVIDIDRFEDQTFKLTTVEYYDDSYVTEYIVELPAVESGLEKISLVEANSNWRFIGKVRQDHIHLSWYGNVSTHYIFYRYKKGDDWGGWEYVGSTHRNYYDIYGLEQGHFYQFSVSSDNSNPANGVMTTLLYTEQSATDSLSLVTAITGLAVQSTKDGFVITWNAIDGELAVGYNVYLGDTLIAEKIKATTFTHPISAEGIYLFKVVAVDIFGREGGAATFTCTIEQPLVQSLTVEQGTWGFIFKWDPITEYFSIIDRAYVTVKGYNLYVDGVAINTEYQGTSFSYVQNIRVGEHRFEVRVVDKFHRESEIAAVALFSVTEDMEVLKLAHTLTPEGYLTLNWDPLEGENEPQVLWYEVRGGASGAALWDQAGTILGTTAATNFSAYIDTVYIKKIFVRAWCQFTSGDDWSLAWLEKNLQTLATPTIQISIDGANILAKWGAVANADFYQWTNKSGGISWTNRTTLTQLSFPVPKYDVEVRVRAWDNDGYFSEFASEEVNVDGIYNWNEVIAMDFDFINGRYLNFAFSTDDKVVRPSILGVGVSPPVYNINDSDLFNLVSVLQDEPASTFEDVPARWFRRKWWGSADGYFESGVYDLSAEYSGRLIGSFTVEKIFHSRNLSDWSWLPAKFLAEYTASEIEDEDVQIEVDFWISSDGEAWKKANLYDWVTCRYFKVKGTMAKASPLDEIKITEGNLSLDVPDIIQDGNILVTGGTYDLTFPRAFNVCNFIMCTASGSATAQHSNESITGFTITVSTAAETKVYWYAKGY
ncbi:MAG: phage tail protein [Desulfatirhabdiaceae bacterium]